MQVNDLIHIINREFFVGVPDSQLKALCDFLMKKKGIGDQHIIAANEGNCVGIAVGHYLATGEVPIIYMQNSGIGNIVNPATSLIHPEVYGIPCIFIIGWRGEPGIHDEPQHIYQGKITEKLFQDLEIAFSIISKETTLESMKEAMDNFDDLLKQGKSVAFLIKKGALEEEYNATYENDHALIRESVIEEIVKVAGEDVIVSTTGKTSRELFEIREKYQQGHEKDFLTVGSMGHSSSIALGIALSKPDTRVWCIDGDGAALMHMGAMALIGTKKPRNMVHIVINNESHETVGGMPTVAGQIDLKKIAEGCGYPKILYSENENELFHALDIAKQSNELIFIEVKSKIFSRNNLGRPTTTAIENKNNFMDYLNICK